MNRPLKLYRRLLRLYPARFREEYEKPMERDFLDEYREARSRWERVRLCLRIILDLAASIPLQTVRECALDLKHSLRAWRRRPLGIALAVAALALAIGAGTGVFSVLNALLLRSLPFARADRLVELWLSPVNALSGRDAFRAWSSQSAYLESAAAFSPTDMNLAGGRDALRVKVTETSANFFDLLGVHPVVGRAFAANEDIFGNDRIAIISFGAWQQLFAGLPEVTGKTIRLNGRPFTIVGVAPPAFDYPEKTNIWTPTIYDFQKIPKYGAFLFRTIGRLKPGIGLRSAQAMFQAETTRSDRQYPNLGDRPRLVSLRNQLAGPVRQAAWVLAALVFVVLLTACTNVAQLILSRTTERRQELAVRAALGASRARLRQQLVTEAMLLTILSAAAGIGIAQWTTRVASSVVPAQLAAQQYTVLDWRVLGLAVALALVTGVLFGSAAAWLSERLLPSGASIRIRPGTTDRGMKTLRAILIFLETALTLCLIASSLTLWHSFRRLTGADLGFRPANVVTLNLSVQGTRHTRAGAPRKYYAEVLRRLRALPGVEAAGAVSYLPLTSQIYVANSFYLDSGQTVEKIVMNAVTPGYFQAMGTAILTGRDFGERDDAVIVNEAFARETGVPVLGRKLSASWSKPLRIIGVVATQHARGPLDPVGPQIYFLIENQPFLTLVARVRGTAESYLAPCRDVVRSVDPEVPVYDVKTLDRRLAENLSRPRFYATATGFLALLAALLSAAGIYGTAAYSIAQRRQEIGIRLAVGASPANVRSLLLRESLLPVAAGAAAGILLSLATGRSLNHLIETAARPAFFTCVIAAGILLAVGFIAAWTASAAALSVDPLESLRAG